MPPAIAIDNGSVAPAVETGTARDYLVVAAHPLAAETGRAILAAKTLSEMGYSNVGAVAGAVEDLIAAVE